MYIYIYYYNLYYYNCVQSAAVNRFFFSGSLIKKNAKQARLDEKKARVAETPTSCWKIHPPAAA